MGHLENTLDALARLLDKGDEADRCNAIRALSTLGDTSCTRQLIERLHDEDIDVAVDAAEALGRLGGDEAVDALLETLQHDPSGEVRLAAVEALTAIADPRSHPALIQIAAHRPEELSLENDWDEWWDIQLKAVEYLGRAKVADAVPALIEILDTEANQDIETELLTALARIGGPAHTFLLERLDSAPTRTRRRIITALGHSRDKAIVKKVGRALNDRDDDVREHAIRALTTLGADKYLSPLLLLLRDRSAKVRVAAAQAIPVLAAEAEYDQELIEILGQCTRDPAAAVRAEALRSLARVSRGRGDALGKAIESGIQDDSPDVLLAAAEAARTAALDDGRRQVVVEPLLAISTEQSSTVLRREALLALGTVGRADEALLEALTQRLADPDQALRLAALSALKSLADKSTDSDAELDPHGLIIGALQGHVDLELARPESAQLSISLDALKEELPSHKDALSETRTEEPEADLDRDPEARLEADVADIPESPVIKTTAGGAQSTLAAIATDNAEAMLLMDDFQEQQDAPELDAETAEYAELLENNTSQAEEMFPDRDKVDVARDVRHLAARILANDDGEAAITALTAALSDEDMMLRAEAARSLAAIADRAPGNPRLLNASGSLLSQLNLGDDYTRMACAQALGRMRNRGATLQLLAALGDESSDVRIHALDALGLLAREGRDPNPGEHQVAEAVAAVDQVPDLVHCLSDDSSGVRIHAADALADLLPGLGDEARGSVENEVITAMIQAALADEGQQARTIARSLKRIAAAESSEQLLPKLDELPSSYERRFVMEMLVELSMPTAQAA